MTDYIEYANAKACLLHGFTQNQTSGEQGAHSGVTAEDRDGPPAGGEAEAAERGATSGHGHRGPGEAAARRQQQQLRPAETAAAAHGLCTQSHEPVIRGIR